MYTSGFMDDVIFVRNGMYGGISLRTTTLQQCRRAQANAPAGKTERKVDTSTPISPPLLHRIVPVLGLPYVRVSPDTSSFLAFVRASGRVFENRRFVRVFGPIRK